MLYRILFAAPLLLTAFAMGQTGPRVGEPGPPLTVGKLFQAPPDAQADLASQKGNVVVLEFWATWCAPCISAMPHINDLANKYRDKPVRFLSVSNEDAATVERFLGRGLLKTWVVADPSQETFRAYGIEFIPRTVVIDPEGKVAMIGGPHDLNERVLDAVLAGNAVPANAAPTEAREAAPSSKPLFRIEIGRATSDKSGMMFNTGAETGGELIAEGMTALDLLAVALSTTRHRIVGHEALPEGRYFAMVNTPPGQGAQLHDALRGGLEQAFGVEVAKEKRSVDAIVLRAPTGPGEQLRPSSSAYHMSTSRGVFSMKNGEIRSMVAYLENNLGRPVIDETGLSGKYDWVLAFDPDERQSLVEGLKQLGIVATAETREIDLFVLRKR
jgi:uncharacterized protein (TIGR03435 family)